MTRLHQRPREGGVRRHDNLRKALNMADAPRRVKCKVIAARHVAHAQVDMFTGARRPLGLFRRSPGQGVVHLDGLAIAADSGPDADQGAVLDTAFQRLRNALIEDQHVAHGQVGQF